MKELIIRLQQYVADHPPNYGDGDCHSILDAKSFTPGTDQV